MRMANSRQMQMQKSSLGPFSNTTLYTMHDDLIISFIPPFHLQFLSCKPIYFLYNSLLFLFFCFFCELFILGPTELDYYIFFN